MIAYWQRHIKYILAINVYFAPLWGAFSGCDNIWSTVNPIFFKFLQSFSNNIPLILLSTLCYRKIYADSYNTINLHAVTIKYECVTCFTGGVGGGGGGGEGARLHARTYTFAHLIRRTTNAARKHGAISPILPLQRCYSCNAIMIINPSMVRTWATGITTMGVVIVISKIAGMREWIVNKCRMRECIKQDARTSLLMRECTHIVRWSSFYLPWINSNPSMDK